MDWCNHDPQGNRNNLLLHKFLTLPYGGIRNQHNLIIMIVSWNWAQS